MYQPLVPCTECRRHLRATEGACPFCRTPRAATSIESGPVVRMSRAAALAAVAASLAVACQSEPQPVPVTKDPVAVKPSPTPSPTPTSEPVPPPAADAGLVDDHGGMVTKYGAPPPPKPPKPGPIAVPAYGLPPPPPAVPKP